MMTSNKQRKQIAKLLMTKKAVDMNSAVLLWAIRKNLIEIVKLLMCTNEGVISEVI